MRKNLIIPLLVTALSLINLPSLFAQERLLNPTATVYDLNPLEQTFVCPDFDVENLAYEDSINHANGGPLGFAKKFETELTPYNSGQWEERDGLKVWRLRLTSPNAYSMMLILKEVNLIENASIFVYDEEMTSVYGPYTSAYCPDGDGIIPTPLVRGSSIIIELVYEGNEELGTPDFRISSVSHDYLNVSGFEQDGFAKPIRLCHNDINCPIGANWQTAKKGVARIIWDGQALCSGSLINNTLAGNTSFFLTAWHCISDNATARTSTFYFNHDRGQCGIGDGETNHIVSGANLMATNNITDFTLLQLNGSVPSSYQPYYAGWDRSGNNPSSATVIHHPKGNVKKISFDTDPIIPNPSTVNFSTSFLAGDAWQVDLDNGTTEGGSSGGPLFNQNGRIIGQLRGVVGGEGCPDPNRLTYYGRLSVSWNLGTTSQERLRDWLDPINSGQTVIEGFAPEGWIHDYLGGYTQSTNRNVYSASNYPTIKTLSVGEGNQVIYRGIDNKMQNYYWDNGAWHHAWLNQWGPSNENVDGDVVVGEGNQVFYRGTDGKLHTYYYNNNAWHHDWLGGWNAPAGHNVSGRIAVGPGNQVFYRGVDGKVQNYYFSNGSWHHSWLSQNGPASENVGGDLEVDATGQVFYRGNDGKIHTFHRANNTWNHDWLDRWGPSNESVIGLDGSIAVGSGGQVFYKGVDGEMQNYYYENGAWRHGWLNHWGPAHEKVNGDITVGEGNSQVFYRGLDGKMHIFYYSNNTWTHDWMETSWQAPVVHNVGGAIEAGSTNQIFYRGRDGRMRIYTWYPSYFARSSKYPNYSMANTPLSPTIPTGNKIVVQDLKIFPNPTAGNFTIEYTSIQDETLQVSLFDLLGKEIWTKSQKMRTGFNSLPYSMDGLKEGMYLIKIKDSKGNQSSKQLIKL